MRFLINNRVIFDEDNLTLALADENADPVVLTAIANRLLALLVKNNNILISRDFIFSAVWEDHGKTASSSNLNNYIASLRRSFSSLGEDEILVTVPRQGFMFTAASIHCVADHMTQDENVPAVSLPVRRRWDVILPKVTLLLTGIALVLAGVYFFTERYDTAYQTQIASYKSCRVETLNDSERIDERYISDALERLKSRGFDCDVPATVYYSRLTYRYTNYKKLIDFISYCPKHRVKNMDAHCEDEFEVINEG
ncbi:winged helix-turn-helix domain-containing protein [Serratia sp. IR-2025]|uniref:winged helix-turn-helix domain-containing protein n=1 Tax=Serratia TaxID=613 RepID=UPI002772E4FE|nr:MULTISPECIES: winged helix-turn-helix domain-containing protein [Serratia]MDP8775237.1 winged helix-turn-helix domain-containing protein [Serratia marcescens]MDP8805646.1 winged helix-turn-helix domain-containing protein [Serratia marcescens]MDR8481202.1 winged helix-turn-helix domain-containing protein [Serratia nevei]WMC74978.1 winged helix-turn-helix domain-containing protein [Serratia nevei]WMC80376.1 winged helix-turn-helix domain-containing protein [Serratia nevei]